MSKRRAGIILTLTVTCAAALALPARAATPSTIIVAPADGQFFDPAESDQTLEPTGLAGFHWTWSDNPTAAEHSVHQESGLFDSGAPTDSNPAGFEIDPPAGVYIYYCEVHRTSGMVGVVSVTPFLTEPFNVNEFDTFGVRWATSFNDVGSLFDARYRVNGGDWKFWKNDTAKRRGTFGNNNKPVKVRPGKLYEVEIRTEKNNTAKHSDFSPPVSYTLKGP
jgi:plastocyanin